MIPIFRGTVGLKLGNQERHEAFWPLLRFSRPIEREYPGGKWIPCMIHNYPGMVWDVPDMNKLWVIRLEIENSVMQLRQLSVRRDEIGYIVPKIEDAGGITN